LELPK
jgi:hypothetical protein